MMRFAMIGAGFWGYFQLAAWRELDGVECVAVCDRDEAKARRLAEARDVPRVYTDAEALFASEKLDFVDIVTQVDGHRPLVEMAARHGVPVICQKPMANTLEEAEAMVHACLTAGVPFYIHENWRWQTPIRALKAALDRGDIGPVFRARIDMISGFPVFRNQPILAELDRFILTDLGVHTLDTARLLFGEADSVYCHTQRIHENIRGEDVATVMMRMAGGATVLCAMGYAENYIEQDRFPETFFFVEGKRGSIHLAPDFWLRVTTEDGTYARRFPPPRYAWADPDYAVAQTSAVACCADLLAGLRGEPGAGQTSAEDNLKTLRLVFAAYDSADRGEAIRLATA